MLHTILFIGRSGCGKGTQADLFKKWVSRRETEAKQILYIETGERFRRFIREESYSSELSRKIYEQDDRQPDFLAAWMWSTEFLAELDDDMHMVIDGAARSENEAKLLTTALSFYKRENPTVVYLDVSREWSEKHLLARGRADDVNLSRIDKRLDWFDKDVLPSIEYFKSDPMYKFIEVDGEQSIEKVHEDIILKYENK